MDSRTSRIHGWRKLETNVKEESPPDLPISEMKPVQIFVYFDASFTCNMITRRSVTGIIVLVNSTPLHWYVKEQNTVESSIYGVELVAGRIATEMAIKFRYIFQVLRVLIDVPCYHHNLRRSIMRSHNIESENA